MPWRRWNPNPCGKSVGDCAVRAVSAALGIDWHDAYALLCSEGLRQCDMPSSDAVWGAVLRSEGFRRQVIPGVYPGCYTAEDFIYDHQRGIYVLAFGGHVATVRDGVLLDSWDSSAEIPVYFYKKRE